MSTRCALRSAAFDVIALLLNALLLKALLLKALLLKALLLKALLLKAFTVIAACDETTSADPVANIASCRIVLLKMYMGVSGEAAKFEMNLVRLERVCDRDVARRLRPAFIAFHLFVLSPDSHSGSPGPSHVLEK